MIRSGIDWSSSSYEDVLARHRWMIPPRFNIAHAACTRHADGRGRLALIAEDEDGRIERFSFDQLEDRSARFAGALRTLGVEAGDRVAVFLPQRVETAVAHLAALRLGAISVPLSPLFRSAALAHRLGHSEAKVVITDVEHRPFLDELELSAAVLVVEADFERAVREHPAAPAAETSADDPAMLIYTSGTSGLPKGALHAHRFLLGRLSAFELLHRLESGGLDRPFWTPADWAWVGGLVDCVLTPWLFGCPVLAYRRRGRFDPQAVFSLLERHRVRSAFFPPTALAKLRAAPARRVELFSMHTAGEPLSAELYEFARSTFGVVYELYGMTEMGATIGNSPFFPVRPGSMGRPYPGHQVELIEGEIAVRAPDPGLFLGYYRDLRATQRRFRGEYFLTGDRAERDADGYFWCRGRDDDMFNTSGYRVGPTEIEASLESHPAVERAAVVGFPDQERGEIVKAFIVLRPEYSPNDALAGEIQSFVKTRLAAYEYPRRIVFARELPLTVTGKIRRVELRAPDADQRYGR